MDENEKRGLFLKELRLKKKLKQTDLALMLNVSDKSISKWERGKCFPKNSEMIIKISKIFNVSVEEIMHGESSSIKKYKKFNFKIINVLICCVCFIIIILNLFYIFNLNFNNKYYYFLKNKFNSFCNKFSNNINKREIELNVDNAEDFGDNFDSCVEFKNIYTSDNNLKDKLINLGFEYNDYIFNRKINDNVYIKYFEKINSIKVYDYSSNLIIVYNKNNSNNFVVEIFDLNHYNAFIFYNDNIINCDIEVCDDYNDYAAYINFIKNKLIE